jgi:hypothetical protein
MHVIAASRPATAVASLAWLPAWRVALVSCVLAVAACGGGGGDDNAAEPPPAPPPVTGALLAPPAQTLQIDQRTTPTALAGQFEVRFSGSTAPAWTAQSDQAWLRLAPATGTGAGTLAYTVDAAQLQSQPNWSTAVATVRISAAGLGDVSTTLTLDKRLPEVTMVWPNAVAAGQAGTVRVLGRGLSQLAGAGDIQVEGGRGVTGTIVSDTEARLNLPVLFRGRHAISVPNSLGAEGPVASLAAVDPSVRPPSFESRYIGQSSFLFDASRQAWFGFYGGSSLDRWIFDGARWVQGSVALPGELGSQNAVWLALAPDRRSVYGYANNQLLAVDPDTLAIQQAYPLPSEWLGTSRRVQPAGITHDMRLWFTLFRSDNNTTSTTFLAYFDLRTQRFEAVQGGPTITTDLAIGAARDGSRLVGVRSAEGTGNFVYRAATSTFADMPSLPASSSGVLNDVGPDGTTFLVGNLHLYSFQEGADLVLQGSLPSAGRFNSSILSPDGSRVYALSTSGATTNVEGITATVLDRVAVFDATTTAAALRPLGTFDLPEPTIVCTGAILVAGCRHGSLQISPLGDTLFWPTFEKFLVVPVPGTL